MIRFVHWSGTGSASLAYSSSLSSSRDVGLRGDEPVRSPPVSPDSARARSTARARSRRLSAAEAQQSDEEAGVNCCCPVTTPDEIPISWLICTQRVVRMVPIWFSVRHFAHRPRVASSTPPATLLTWGPHIMIGRSFFLASIALTCFTLTALFASAARPAGGHDPHELARHITRRIIRSRFSATRSSSKVRRPRSG